MCQSMEMWYFIPEFRGSWCVPSFHYWLSNRLASARYIRNQIFYREIDLNQERLTHHCPTLILLHHGVSSLRQYHLIHKDLAQ